MKKFLLIIACVSSFFFYFLGREPAVQTLSSEIRAASTDSDQKGKKFTHVTKNSELNKNHSDSSHENTNRFTQESPIKDLPNEEMIMGTSLTPSELEGIGIENKALYDLSTITNESEVLLGTDLTLSQLNATAEYNHQVYESMKLDNSNEPLLGTDLTPAQLNATAEYNHQVYESMKLDNSNEPLLGTDLTPSQLNATAEHNHQIYEDMKKDIHEGGSYRQ